MPGTGIKNQWTCPMMDMRGLMSADPFERRIDQAKFNAAHFVPYQCRANRERPKHLRVRAVHRTGRSGRPQAARRRAAGAGSRTSGKGATSGGGGGGGDGDGPGDGGDGEVLVGLLQAIGVLDSRQRSGSGRCTPVYNTGALVCFVRAVARSRAEAAPGEVRQ
jgi:hypothetical protein